MLITYSELIIIGIAGLNVFILCKIVAHILFGERAGPVVHISSNILPGYGKFSGSPYTIPQIHKGAERSTQIAIAILKITIALYLTAVTGLGIYTEKSTEPTWEQVTSNTSWVYFVYNTNWSFLVLQAYLYSSALMDLCIYYIPPQMRCRLLYTLTCSHILTACSQLVVSSAFWAGYVVSLYRPDVMGTMTLPFTTLNTHLGGVIISLLDLSLVALPWNVVFTWVPIVYVLWWEFTSFCVFISTGLYVYTLQNPALVGLPVSIAFYPCFCLLYFLSFNFCTMYVALMKFVARHISCRVHLWPN